MSGLMKARRTKQDVRVQVGGRKPRLFLVPKEKAEKVVELLEKFEVSGDDSAPWQAPVQDLIQAYSQPGATLRGARGKEGMSQTGLALKLGIPPSNISEMESGKRPIGKNMAKRLSKILKIDYRVFL